MIAYTFIRTDMALEHQLVQACHSSMEAGSDFKESGEIPHLILLSIRDSEDLAKAEELIKANGIRYHKFFEPDNNLGFTSITTEPITYEQKKIFSNYRLWRSK